MVFFFLLFLFFLFVLFVVAVCCCIYASNSSPQTRRLFKAVVTDSASSSILLNAIIRLAEYRIHLFSLKANLRLPYSRTRSQSHLYIVYSAFLFYFIRFNCFPFFFLEFVCLDASVHFLWNCLGLLTKANEEEWIKKIYQRIAFVFCIRYAIHPLYFLPLFGFQFSLMKAFEKVQ